MKDFKGTKIVAVEHGYGNIKTANTVTPTGITAYETEPIFSCNTLEYNAMYYRIGDGHKEFIPNKAMDEGLAVPYSNILCQSIQQAEAWHSEIIRIAPHFNL